MSKHAITYEGNDVAKLKKDFEGAIDDYIASCSAPSSSKCWQKK